MLLQTGLLEIRMRKLAIVAALLLIGLSARQADAHKINIFAYAEGKTIHGEAYARGGEAIRGAKVEVFDPADGMKKLGETVTDDEGKFTFEARLRSDHRLVLDTGDGHEAEYTLPADELPESLPAPDGTPDAPAEPTANPNTAPEVAPSPQPAAPLHDESIEEQLRSLNQQVVQLRRELNEYRQKVQFRDILGAIGYILGAMGLSFYFLGVKKKRSTTKEMGRDREQP
jgi:nickel transport protein